MRNLTASILGILSGALLLYSIGFFDPPPEIADIVTPIEPPKTEEFIEWEKIEKEELRNLLDNLEQNWEE